MAIKLNHGAVDYAKSRIRAGEVEHFADWNEVRPTPTEVDEFIEAHYMSEYGKWFLGKDDAFPEDVKEHYVYPYGDLKEVQRSALVATLAQAEENQNLDVAGAAAELLKLVDETKGA